MLANLMYSDIGRVSFHSNVITQCSIYFRTNSECHSITSIMTFSGKPNINKSTLPARLGVQ